MANFTLRESDLNPCRCGGVARYVEVEETPKPDHTWFKVSCAVCGLETEVYYHKGYAFAAWQRGQLKED